MGEKVVLPKFELPGDRMHPALKVLAIVGGMMVLCTAILGMALWRHHSQQMAAEARQEALIAQRTAEANAQAEAAKARAAEAAAKIAAAQAAQAAKAQAAKTPSSAATLASADADAGKSTGSHRRSSSGHHRSSKATATAASTKTVAKAGGEEKKAAVAKKKGDDAVDKILASFK
jgi:hypothetical protein